MKTETKTYRKVMGLVKLHWLVECGIGNHHFPRCTCWDLLLFLCSLSLCLFCYLDLEFCVLYTLYTSYSILFHKLLSSYSFIPAYIFNNWPNLFKRTKKNVTSTFLLVSGWKLIAGTNYGKEKKMWDFNEMYGLFFEGVQNVGTKNIFNPWI